MIKEKRKYTKKNQIISDTVKHVIPISGKDSLATALIQTTRQPDLEYEFFFNDVGTELPETYEWLDLVEKTKGWRIIRVGKNLTEVIKKNKVLPSSFMRFCTTEAKIVPMEQFYKSQRVVIYYGLRADELHRAGKRPSDTMTHIFPLQETGIDLRGVWTILKYQNLLPPSFFWTRLYYAVCERLGDRWEILNELEEWEFRMIFAGRSRSNCYFCFYQRQYEYLWLSETHPDLFYESCKLERTIGGKSFSWKKDYFLDEKIYQDGDKIFNRRIEKVMDILDKRFNRGLMFSDYELENELSMTSCGFLCGK